MIDKIPVADVAVGDPVRRDFGDLSELMLSLEKRGQLQPLGVLPGNRLLLGGQRLQAVKRLGWPYIECTYVLDREDAMLLTMAECEQDVCRKEVAA